MPLQNKQTRPLRARLRGGGESLFGFDGDGLRLDGFGFRQGDG